MLTKPVNGRCKFSFFDFEVQISCVNDIPVNWLDACKNGLEGGGSIWLPISCILLLDNGYEYAALLLDEKGVSIIDFIDGNRSVFHYDVSLAEFTEELLRDIEDNLAGWVNWYPAEILGGPDTGREEMLRNLLADTREALHTIIGDISFGERKGDIRKNMKNKITIYRGSHQIGGCVTEVKTGNHRIVIDFGANLPDSKEDDVMTDEELLHTVFNGEPCDGVLFTHYHGDHIGLYKNIPKDIPLYIGSTAKKILEILTEKLDSISNTAEKGLPRVQGMNVFLPREEISEFGDIRVTPFVVDHSALDAYMFLIEIDGKRILFTGDFREHGIAGEKNTFEKLINTYIGKIDILITEGTMLSRREEAKWNPIQTEKDLGKRARKLFQENKESVILVSSTNLDSIMEFYHALPWGMGFVCDAYQAKLMLAAMEDKGKYYSKYRPEMIHGKPRALLIVGKMEGLGRKQNCYEANFDILKNKGFTMLARESKPMFAEKMAKFSDPLIIYSKWSGYLEGEHANAKIQEFIGNHRMEKLHTSGHAYVETIEKLIRMTKPEVVIPMHTECADEFGRIETFSPYRDKVRVLQDGEEFSF